jgi:hypothetical protein
LTCGACDEGEACDGSGQCETAPTGDQCVDPFEVDALPFTDSGDTSGASNNYAYGFGQCPGDALGSGAGSNDEVYRFEPSTDGVYTIDLTSADFNAVLYVVSDCADESGTCLGAAYYGEDLLLELEQGQTYFIIVDGVSNDSDASGLYDISVSAPCSPSCSGKECGDDGCGSTCGECAHGEICNVDTCETAPTGDQCVDPFEIDAGNLPDVLSGDTTDASNRYAWGYDQCPAADMAGYGGGSNDEVYAFTPDASDYYTFSLTADFQTVLYVVTDCEDIGDSCLGADFQYGSDEVLELEVDQNTTYFIIVDGYSEYSNEAGTYTLTVDVSG